MYAAEPAAPPADGAAVPPAPPPPPPQAAPGIYVEQPPLPPPAPRTRHLHDGFYLRLSAGIGAMAIESDYGSIGESTVAGGGGVFDVAIGGSPAPGFVIGGGLLVQDAFRPSYEYRLGGFEGSGTSDSEDGAVPFVLFGPLLDIFPDPDGGFHFGGLLGIASVGMLDDNENASRGFGISVWAGYMWWVSSQWSLGGMLRLSGARTERDGFYRDPDQAVVDSTRSYSFLFSAAFH